MAKWRLGALLALGIVAASACYGGGSHEKIDSVSQAMANPCNDPSNATIIGTAGDDYLLGTEGNDVIFGLDGDDIIMGKGGDDIICAGPGKDSVQGGEGDDSLYGGPGYNWLYGDGGDDHVVGGDDGNELQGNAGQDTILGGLGNDSLYGGDDDDLMSGGPGNDALSGGAGDDGMSGGSGDDRMSGDSGNDCMDGGAGDDWMSGLDGDDGIDAGSGQDKVMCGAGVDTHEGGEWGLDGCESGGGAVTCDPGTPGHDGSGSGGPGPDSTSSSSSGGGPVACFEADCSMYPGDPACCPEDTSICSPSGVCELVPGDIKGTIWWDFDGNGVHDASEPGAGNAPVAVFADSNPADGLPDGPPIAVMSAAPDGSYNVGGLLGGYVVRVDLASLPPGFCLTGNLGGVTVLGSNPKDVVSGVDIGITSTGCP